MSRQIAVSRRRHRAADAHASASSRRRRSPSCRSSSAPRSCSVGGCDARAPACRTSRRGDGGRRRSVLADPHRAELSSRGGGDAPLRRRSSADVVDAAVHAREASRDVLRRRRLHRVRRRRRRALAGRPARARRRADAGALVSFLLYAITVAAAVGSLASLFGSYQEAIGAASRVFELLDTRADRRRARAARCRSRGRCAATSLLEHVASATRPTCRRCCTTSTLHDRAGRSRRARRPVGRRQDDGRVAAPALLGRDRAAASRSTASTFEISHSPICAARSASCRRSRRCSAARSARTSPTRGRTTTVRRRPRTRSSPRRAPRTRSSSSSGCPTGSTRASASAASSCPAASASGSRSRGSFCKNPAVVVLDEATSSLDTESERAIEAAMEDLLRGRSTLIIAHRLSTVRRADRVLVLEHGRIVETGTHERAARAAAGCMRGWRAMIWLELGPQGWTFLERH